jgi:hypothetical protein
MRFAIHTVNVKCYSLFRDHLDRGVWGEWLDPDTEPHAYNNPIDTSADGDWIDPFEPSKHFLRQASTSSAAVRQARTRHWLHSSPALTLHTGHLVAVFGPRWLRLDDLFVAWDDWPGMADVVAEERQIEAKFTPAKL